MSRFYVPSENIKDKVICVRGDEAHHIVKVMRLKENDEVTVFDGTGREYSGYIEKVDARGKKVTVRVVSVKTPATGSMPHVTLAQAIPKKKKMDYIVQKATELGVSVILPLLSDRTIVKPGLARSEKMVSRWERLAMVASKQCGRSKIPEIMEPEAFLSLASRLKEFDIVLLAVPGSEEGSFKRVFQNFTSGKVLVIIGPEGGFSKEELGFASSPNCYNVSLGKRILKSDTAGLFILSVIVYNFLPQG